VAGVNLDAASIAIPSDVTMPADGGARPVTDADVRAILRPYRAGGLLVNVLASIYDTDESKLHALATLANQSLATEELVRAVRGDGTTQPVFDVLEALTPLALAFDDRAWDSAAIDFVRANAGVFGEGPLPRTIAEAASVHTPYFTLEQLRGLSVYAELARPLNESGRADLRALLASFDPTAAEFPATALATLDILLDSASGVSASVHGRLSLAQTAAHALARYRDAVRLAERLGVDGQTLADAVTEDFSATTRAADVLMTSVRRSAETTAAADSADETLWERQRDALVDVLTTSLAPETFAGAEDLYHYFLIDVATSGCASTSPVVAAISSLQLYIHRVLMNLEQDDLPPAHPDHLALRMPRGGGSRVEVAKELPRLGSEPEGVPLARKLPRARSAR